MTFPHPQGNRGEAPHSSREVWGGGASDSPPPPRHWGGLPMLLGNGDRGPARDTPSPGAEPPTPQALRGEGNDPAPLVEGSPPQAGGGGVRAPMGVGVPPRTHPGARRPPPAGAAPQRGGGGWLLHSRSMSRTLRQRPRKRGGEGGGAACSGATFDPEAEARRPRGGEGRPARNQPAPGRFTGQKRLGGTTLEDRGAWEQPLHDGEGKPTFQEGDGTIQPGI